MENRFIIKEDAQGTHQLSLSAFHTSEGRLFLNGPITSESVGKLIESMIYMSRNEIPITLFLDTNGGEARAGLALIDVIKIISERIPVTIVCLSKAYSMGAIILAAGTKGRRYLLPHSEVMIHEPLIPSGAGGSASSVKSTAESLMEMRDIFSKLLSEYTGKTQNAINEAMSHDHFLNADEAIKFGIADAIIGKL